MDGEKLVVGFVPLVMRIADLPEAESCEIDDNFPYDHFFADHGSLTDNSEHKNASGLTFLKTPGLPQQLGLTDQSSDWLPGSALTCEAPYRHLPRISPDNR